MAMAPSSKAYGDDERHCLGVRKRRAWDWERCAAEIRGLRTFSTAEEAAEAYDHAVIRFCEIKQMTNFPNPVVSPSWGPIPVAGGSTIMNFSYCGRGRMIPVPLRIDHPAVPAAARGGASVTRLVKIAPAPPKLLNLFPGSRSESMEVVGGKTRRAPRGRGLRKTGTSAAAVAKLPKTPVSRGFELDLDLNFPPSLSEDRSLDLRLGLI